MLEVIACSVADAIAAERGGAGRLEVVSNLAAGGLTPPVELVREICATMRIPVRVMLRESEGYTFQNAAEVERLFDLARQLSRLQIDGLVFGFLRDGEVDTEITERILSCAPNLKATFHHAFEETSKPLRTIKLLKRCHQFDRILTHGGSGEWPEKIKRLAEYEREAQPEMTILAGGEMTEQVIWKICEATRVREFHIGRAVRVPQEAKGVVQAERVRELVSVIQSSSAECRMMDDVEKEHLP